MRPWRPAAAARRRACGRPWARWVMPMTTPCAGASSPPWHASCWTGVGSRPRPTPAWPASASSKADTTPYACIPAWAAARLWPTKQPRRWPKPNRSHPSPPTLHEGGATSTSGRGCRVGTQPGPRRPCRQAQVDSTAAGGATWRIFRRKSNQRSRPSRAADFASRSTARGARSIMGRKWGT